MIHPRSFSSRRLAGLALFLLVLSGFGAWWGVSHLALAARKPSEAPPVPVVLARARQQEVTDYVTGIGTAQATASVTVRALVDGLLQNVQFSEGQEVRAGTVLAQIDPAPYRAQYDQARAQKAKDEALLANARLDLQRYAELLKLDAVPQQTFEAARAQAAQLEATVQVDQAQVDYAKVQLDRTTVTAPISGRTGMRLVDAGNLVRAAEATGIVVVNQIEPITVSFSLPEESVERVNRAIGGEAAARGGKALQVVAYARDEATPLARGTLLLVNNQIDSATGTVQLKATFPNRERRLWPGQFVNVRLVLGSRDESLVVPASAVQRGPEGTFAYVVGEDGALQVRALQVALLQEGQAVIAAGLRSGESVVAEGHAKLKPGARVVDSRAAAEAPPRAQHAGEGGR